MPTLEGNVEVASGLSAGTAAPAASADPSPQSTTPSQPTEPSQPIEPPPQQPTPPEPTTHSVDLATLQSVDLATIILTERAKATRGWCRELVVTAEVCSAWREALQVVEKTACSWQTFTWRVKAFSQLCKSKAPDEGVVVRPELASGVHDWQLWLVPRACRHEQPQEDDEPQRLVEVLGVYLQVPSPLEHADGWARRTEAEMTLHHATDPKASRRRYFRHRFTAAVTDWGHPDQTARSSFGESAELARPAAGFVTDDTLTITARIRVSPGRLFCTKEAKGCPAHPLVRADGLACHVEAVGERLLFHCDLCSKTLPTHVLHRCARACNFDASAPARTRPPVPAPAQSYPHTTTEEGRAPPSPVCCACAGVPCVLRPGGAQVGVKS